MVSSVSYPDIRLRHRISRIPPHYRPYLTISIQYQLVHSTVVVFRKVVVRTTNVHGGERGRRERRERIARYDIKMADFNFSSYDKEKCTTGSLT